MAKVLNISSSALDVPTFGRVILPDESVACNNATAATFEGQPEWQIEYDEVSDEPAPAVNDNDEV